MITINIVKARVITHEFRRKRRSWEFAPLDSLIASNIPGTDPQAIEAQRQQIRDKYAVIQVQIDEAQTPQELTAILDAMYS
jgi:hypothetical protein